MDLYLAYSLCMYKIRAVYMCVCVGLEKRGTEKNFGDFQHEKRIFALSRITYSRRFSSAEGLESI